jgi:hypothetical protein
LNVYNLFTDSSITDYCVAYYHSSSVGTYDTLTKEVNLNNVPDVTIKDIYESFNPIDFHKLSLSGETPENSWDNFISENSDEDKLIEQYHIHSSSIDANNHVTSIRFFGLVYGPNLDIISLHSYKISSIFELPESLELEGTKVKDHHYYELTTNFIKNDSAGILSTHEVLMSDETWREISDVLVGEDIKSYSISGSPESESDLNSITWNYEGGEFPEGSSSTTSSVIFKDVKQLKYGAMMEMIVDNDSLFSGINKKYLVYDISSDTSSFKFISEINDLYDYLYDINGDLIKVDELNFYVSTDTNLSFIELDVEESDTYIVNGSTAFNSLVSHNSPCFVAGTKILMESGNIKNIEDVLIGDLVTTFDFKNNTKKDYELFKNFYDKFDFKNKDNFKKYLTEDLPNGQMTRMVVNPILNRVPDHIIRLEYMTEDLLKLPFIYDVLNEKQIKLLTQHGKEIDEWELFYDQESKDIVYEYCKDQFIFGGYEK